MASSFPSLSQPASGFPLPTVSEDTLFYNIHIPSTEDAAATALLVSDFVSSLLPTPWLWNKDAWELKVPQDDGVGRARGALKDQHKLSGTMRVGDAVDDEWLIVWLLREVSRKWPEFVISIRDTDGEFLLIEAANELPSWVSPDNAENRLWLSAGQLHLIPLSVRSSKGSVRFVPDDETLERQYDPDAQLSEEDAIAAVRTERYQASRDIQSAVWDRIAHYPSKMSDHLHHTKAYLPLPVARALSQNPSLIQKAVEGFYVRDPAQLRGAARMTHFPPSTAILAPVLLTRAAYAQLQGQVFHPPRVFGPEWHVTAAQEGKTDEQLERERRWRDIGVKIATGFEIMYKEGGKSKRGDASSSGDIPRDDPEWQAYMSKLKSAGFFGDELEGSQKWQERQAKALHGWQDITRSSDTAQFRPSFALLVEEALAKALENASELSAKPTDTEDSDSWLEVSPDDLDAILLKASGTDNQPDTSPKNAAAEAASADGMEAEHPLKELAQKVQAFVGGQGDLQGARFEDEFSDDDDVNDSDDEDGTQTRPRDEDDDEEVPADPWDRMTPAEKEARMSNLVSALPIEEWGKKPDPPKAKAIPATENTKVDQSSSTSPSKAKAASMFKQDFDGVESDSESEDDEDAELPAAGTLGRKIAQMRWADGAPQIEEINEDEDVDMDAAAGGEEDEEDRLDRMREKSLRWDDGIDEAMRKRVWGADGAASAGKVKAEDRPVVVNADEAADEGDAGMDVDMEKEMNDFLTFARETLGVGEDQWDGILKSREERGAFVPGATTRTMAAPAPAQAATGSATKPASTSIITPAPPPASSAPDTEDPGADLDTFEKVMAAMDTQLSSAKRPNAPTPSSSNGETKSKPSSAPLPPLPTEADLEALSQDDLLQMDRELRAALKSAGIDDEDDDDDLMGELDPEEAKALKGEDREEYRMMRDFLESYRSQGGQGGAVGNLLGRLSGAGKGGK